MLLTHDQKLTHTMIDSFIADAIAGDFMDWPLGLGKVLAPVVYNPTAQNIENAKAVGYRIADDWNQQII